MRLAMWILAGALIVTVLPVAATHRTPDAEKITEEMIKAHGGMKGWRSAPTVTFEDLFTPAGAPAGQTSRVTVEQTSRRAYIDFPGTEMRITWDGSNAWSENWSVPIPPRFLVQLNYYFVNLPWLTMDDGVNLGDVGRARLWDDPVEYVTILMTFDAGVGDTPEDYYVLYIHPESKQLKACKYVVTYKALLTEGQNKTREHVLVFDSHKNVDGLLMPTHYTVYELDHTPYATCAFDNWSFTQPFDTSRMKMPRGAVLDESMP